jgi:mannose-6-phosphate isomerase-like protein (cupin superfamily)/catechol 2,3-dioxygenase-like lactoylglutathione lyase family enzyme
MLDFEAANLLAQMSQGEGQAWREFLRVPSVSMGVYRLRAGGVDGQSPHTEDEVYYVISGRARFRAGSREREVEAGTILFVARNVEHRFFDIREDLIVLVFFAPAEHSMKHGAARLTHVNVTMPQGGEEAARAFYHGLLGLPEIPKPEMMRGRGGVWFEAGGLDVHLSVESNEAGPDIQRHFGVEVADVDELRARLAAAGVATEDGRPAPWRRFYVRDPFGNRIEIHEIGGLRA